MVKLILLVAIILLATETKAENEVLTQWQSDFKDCNEDRSKLQKDLENCLKNPCNDSEKSNETVSNLKMALRDTKSKLQTTIEENEMFQGNLGEVNENLAELNESYQDIALELTRLTSTNQDLETKIERQMELIDKKSNIIEYLEDYIRLANLTIGHYCLTDQSFKNPRFLYLFGKDNPLAAIIYLFPWTCLTILVIYLSGKGCQKRSQKRKIRQSYMTELRNVARSGRKQENAVVFDGANQRVKITRPTRKAPPPPVSSKTFLQRSLPDIPDETNAYMHVQELKSKVATLKNNSL